MSIFLAEFTGTMLLILLGGGVVGGVLLNHSKSQNGGWLLINMGWALAVTLAVYAVGKYSGAHLNPAVTLGLACIDEFVWNKVPLYLAAQFSGAFVGAVLVYFYYMPHWSKTEDKALKLAVFATDPAINRPWSNFLSEFMATAVLLMGILFLGANETAKGIAPLLTGLLILSIGISLGSTTGYAINPARDFSPRLAHFLLPIPGKGSSEWKYAWVPFFAPLLGGIFGALAYKALFVGSYSPLFWIFSGLFIVLMVMSLVKDRK